MRNTIATCILEKARENKDFMLLSGDAGLGVWEDYQRECPAQYINPGINEALCVGMAAGMAMCGKKVVYYNIAPFVIMRPYEQVRNDICYQELPVILIGTGSGLTYMPSGMTHYAIEDILLASSLPNLNIFSPCDPLEARACFEYAYTSPNPSYIRIPKAGEPLLHTQPITDISAPQILHEGGSELAIITHSSMIGEVLEAAKRLQASVITMPFINSASARVGEVLNRYKRVVVVEEHYSYGGLGTWLRWRVRGDIEIIGLEHKFIHLIGNQSYGRAHFGLDSQGIYERIEALSSRANEADSQSLENNLIGKQSAPISSSFRSEAELGSAEATERERSDNSEANIESSLKHDTQNISKAQNQSLENDLTTKRSAVVSQSFEGASGITSAVQDPAARSAVAGHSGSESDISEENKLCPPPL